MSRVIYYLFIIPISRLPFPVLYLVSDFCFLLLYYLIPYRKKVVKLNIRNSFPEKSEKEIEIITRKFYQNFCDIILETFKTFTISEKELKKRLVQKNVKLVHELYEKKRSAIAVTGHYCNWEWVVVGSAGEMKHNPFGIYLPLNNKYFDEKLKKTRARFGMQLVSVKKTKEHLAEKKDELTITGFISDQTPSNVNSCHWMKFLNQDTPVHFGVEKYAKDFNLAIVYGKTTRIKRGFYELDFLLITEHPREEEHGAISEKHMKILEKQIKESPENWLWTHRRWKHKKPDHVVI